MLRNIQIFLWEIVSFLEDKLYPYTDNGDYYIKIKDDNTGEEYLIIDWIKSHNQKIDRLQDEMVYVKDQIRKFQNKNG